MNNQTREKVGGRGGQYVKNALNCNRKCTVGCWWMEPKERGWRSISRRMMQSEHSPCLGPTQRLIHLAAIKQPIYLMWKVALFDNSEKGKKEKARRETCKKACASAAGVSQKTSLILISEQWKKKNINKKKPIHVCFFPFFFLLSTKQCIVGMWTLPCIQWSCSLEAKCMAEQKGDA